MKKGSGCLSVFLTAILVIIYCSCPIVAGMLLADITDTDRLSLLIAVYFFCKHTALAVFSLHMLWRSTFKRTAKLLTVIAVGTIITTFLFRTAYLFGNDNKLWALLGNVLGIIVIIMICGTLCLFYRVSRYKVFPVCLTTSALLIASVICAVNDFPYFLRHIKGEDFLNIYISILIGCHASGCLTAILANKITLSRHPSCDYSQLTDKELLDLCDDNTYRRSGYYLLKAKLYNIITFEREKHEVNNTYSEALISLNPALSKKKLEELSRSDPDLADIISFLKKHKEPIDVSYILTLFRPAKNTGKTNESRAVKAHMKKSRRLAYIIYFSFVLSGSALGILKLMMGVYNGKETGTLSGMLFGAQLIFLLIIVAIMNFFLSRSETSFKENILKMLSNPSSYDRHLIDRVDYSYTCLSNDEIKQTLRSYCTYISRPNSDKKLIINNSFCTEIFKSAATLFILDKKSSSSDSGCSSCSSCSSCGGCGGCGGCGD